MSVSFCGTQEFLAAAMSFPDVICATDRVVSNFYRILLDVHAHWHTDVLRTIYANRNAHMHMQSNGNSKKHKTSGHPKHLSPSMFSIRGVNSAGISEKKKKTFILKACLLFKSTQKQLNLQQMIFKQERSIRVGGRHGMSGIMQPMRNRFMTGSSQSLTKTSRRISNPNRNTKSESNQFS